MTLESFRETLSTAKDINPHYAFLDRCVEKTEHNTVRSLFSWLCDQGPFGPQQWAPRGVMEQLLQALALKPELASAQLTVEFTLALTSQTAPLFPFSNTLRKTAVASKLAAAQSFETLLHLLAECEDPELAGLLLHEAILRGHDLATTHEAPLVVEKLHWEKHPLAWLPLTLHEVERDFPRYLPQYRARSRSALVVGATAALPVALPQELTLENVAFEECHDTLRSQQIASAAKNWERESNGKWEARIFSVDQMPDLTLFLPQLSVEALDNVTGEVQASLCSLESMLSLLFWAASSGGAYNHGEYSAYGRLRVWESLAGFISLDTTTSLEARVALARKCAWYQVAPTSDWFCKVIWDIFICCLNPIRHEVVLLAATDTD